jgi:hypothetical protein
MPFFDHTGKELESGEVSSRHVYTPADKLLTRDQLRSCVTAAGYAIQVVDPSDFLPLSDGTLEGECLLVADKAEVLAELPQRRIRRDLLRQRGVVLIDLVVECPFKAAEVFGTTEGLVATFGPEGARHLQSANTLYAIDVPSQASPLVDKVQRDIPKAMAKAVSGVVYDCDQGAFL